MAQKQLNVIALISGGKDSLYSILHCIRNGHRVVALANLHPPLPVSKLPEANAQGGEDEEEDMDSFMYQTIGHSVIPLYESALGIPLYRAPIHGSAVEMGREYAHADSTTTSSKTDSGADGDGDETESLVPLLQAVMRDHPAANAVSAGAILSTYQRTRIENVAARLGLVSLAWLWMYPTLPPPEERLKCPMEMGSPAGLLEDMASCGCEARTVKAASGGLDESCLWMDVSEKKKMGGVRAKIIARMRRFVGEEELNGAVLGEGGEYETLALDGPGFLWKRKIVVESWEGRTGEGGVGFVRIKGAKCTEKDEEEKGMYGVDSVRVPRVLDDDFVRVFDRLRLEGYEREIEGGDEPKGPEHQQVGWSIWDAKVEGIPYTIYNLTAAESGSDASEQMEGIAQKLKAALQELPGRSTDDIVFSTIVLRKLSDFTTVNEIYSKLFQKPNPPARVTVACGDCLPRGVDIMTSFQIDTNPRGVRQGLHVQSRSYWAPANIGPYSQAICVPLEKGRVEEVGGLVYIAGQIPLDPASMEVSEGSGANRGSFEPFAFRSVLSLQHLWRIGRAMEVRWWLGAVAFLAGRENVQARARIASEAWKAINMQNSDSGIEEEKSDDESFDVWDIKYGGKGDNSRKDIRHIPALEVSSAGDKPSIMPPFFAVQVDELPRGSDIEWQSQGLRCSNISRTEDCGNDVHVTHTLVGSRDRLSDRLVVAYIGIGIEHSGPGLGDVSAQHVIRVLKIWPSLTFNPVIYTPEPLAMEGSGAGQVIPCRSVFGSAGERLAAGIVLHIRLDPDND